MQAGVDALIGKSGVRPGQFLAGKTVMVIGTDPWNSPLLSKHRLVLELCRQNQVVYVEPFYHLGKLFKPRYWRQAKGATYHEEYPQSLTFVQPYRLPKSAYVPALREISEWVFSLQVWLKQSRPDLIISFSPYFPFLAGQKSIFVYYPVDSYGHPEAHADSILCENKTLERADLVVCGTQKIFHRFQGRTRPLEFLPHGVAVEAVTRSANQIPEDMLSIPRPIVGFLGALNFRLNLALLEQIARSRPEWSIVLVGPSSQNDFGGGLSLQDIALLKQFPNVYLPGPRRSDEVGAYLAAFDVCIMPYDTTHPLVHFASHKPLQCLAVGTPVVTTCMASDEILPPNTFVAETTTEFIATIDRVLNTHTSEMKHAYRTAAANYTWRKRLEQLEQWIVSYGLDNEAKQR